MEVLSKQIAFQSRLEKIGCIRVEILTDVISPLTSTLGVKVTDVLIG